MIRLENMLTYIVLNIVEAIYIIHDILSSSHKSDLHSPYEMVPQPSIEQAHPGTPLLHGEFNTTHEATNIVQ